MNVAELIKVLQELPQDALVVINGYEGGVNEVSNATETKIEQNVNTAWYYGDHEINEDSDTVAVYIS